MTNDGPTVRWLGISKYEGCLKMYRTGAVKIYVFHLLQGQCYHFNSFPPSLPRSKVVVTLAFAKSSFLVKLTFGNKNKLRMENKVDDLTQSPRTWSKTS